MLADQQISGCSGSLSDLKLISISLGLIGATHMRFSLALLLFVFCTALAEENFLLRLPDDIREAFYSSTKAPDLTISRELRYPFSELDLTDEFTYV